MKGNPNTGSKNGANNFHQNKVCEQKVHETQEKTEVYTQRPKRQPRKQSDKPEARMLLLLF